MMKKIFSRLVLAALVAAAATVTAQEPVRDFNRERTVDIQHYVIRAAFDRPTKTVFGETTVSFKPLADGLRVLTLDSEGLQYQSVILDSSKKALEYRAASGSVTVTLDRAYSASETVSVTFRYWTRPKKGVYFVAAKQSGRRPGSPAQIWTQGEPEEARHWFPSYDFPDDKATTEQILTIPEGETAIANGELVEKRSGGNGTTTFHYRMPVPHSVYLVSFVIGKYALVEDRYGDIPLGYYVYPGTESIAPKAYGKTKDMMRIFEDLTGIPYPYNKYDQTMVADFAFGGMENITATTMADSEIFLAEEAWGRNLVEDLVAHELAHSWFGNLVTCRNWAELWLNESFATFMEAAYREKMYGREQYLEKIRQDAAQYFADEARFQKRRGVFNQLARPDDSIFDAITYNKGGAVLHTLRETVGDGAFWKAINIYLNRHKFGNVETKDLKAAFEEVSGRDLDWFFKQWIYGGRYPMIEYRQLYNPRSGTLRLTVNQVQPADQVSPVPFVIPMEIEVRTARSTSSHRLEIGKRTQVFTIRTDARPIEIVFDPAYRIPLKTVTRR